MIGVAWVALPPRSTGRNVLPLPGRVVGVSWDAADVGGPCFMGGASFRTGASSGTAPDVRSTPIAPQAPVVLAPSNPHVGKSSRDSVMARRG